MNQQIDKNAIYRINRKLVREIAKLGHKFEAPNGSVGHMLPFVIVRNDKLGMDEYQVIDFKDMPAEALANLGLQKISEKQVGQAKPKDKIDWERPQLVRHKKHPEFIVAVDGAQYQVTPREFNGTVLGQDTTQSRFPFAKDDFEYHGEIEKISAND